MSRLASCPVCGFEACKKDNPMMFKRIMAAPEISTKLIAAAPDLLAALTTVINNSFYGESTGYYHLDPKAHAAARAARAYEDSLYGYNVMRSYGTEPEYNDALAYLKENGKQVLA